LANTAHLWIAALCVSLGSGLASAETKLLEGFENPNAIVVTTGQLTLVSQRPPVTEGGGACRLAGGTEIRLSVPAKDVAPFSGGWLRLDTHHAGPFDQPLRVTVSAGKASASLTGYVRPGADTLAVPVARFLSEKDLKAGQVNLRIENRASIDVVLDNLRLETPATPPAGAVRLDLGRGDIWPGFTPVDREGVSVLRFDKDFAHAGSVDWPDPLRGDFIGGSPWGSGECQLTLGNNYPDGAAVWVWLTHFGPGNHQPALVSFDAGRQGALRRILPLAQMLSTAGVFEGAGASWSPEWARKELIPRRFEQVALRLAPGRTRSKLIRAQIAAVFMVPYKTRKDGAAFVSRLEAELATYFRQWMLPAVDRTAVPPKLSEREARSGIVVYLSGDAAHGSSVNLADQPALTELTVTLAPGSRFTAPIVVYPVGGGSRPTVRTGPYIHEKAAMLPRTVVKIDWLAEVTARIDGRPVDRAWYRAPIQPAAVAGKPMPAMLNIECPKGARPGSYSGPITLLCREAEWIVRLTIKVVPLPAAPTHGTFGVLRSSPLSSAYGPAWGMLGKPQRLSMLRKAWRGCPAYGLNAVVVRGPTFDWNGRHLIDAVTIESVQAVPPGKMTGLNMIDISDAATWISRKHYAPGSPRFNDYFGRALTRALTLAGNARITKPLIYLGHASREDDLKSRLPVGEVLRSTGFAPAVSIPIGRWKELPKAARDGYKKEFEALIFHPEGTGATAMVAAAAAGARGHVMLYLPKPDRYSCGFYAWATGSRGVFLPYPFSPYPAYNPFYFTGYGLFMPTAKGEFLPTVNAYGLRQGVDDYDLLVRCAALAEKAKAKKFPDRGLTVELGKIRQAVLAAGAPIYNETLLRSDQVPPSQLNQWRHRLLELAGALAGDLNVR